MSYFTYYGKLKDELFVAVLPNGTVEADDPIHIYSGKQTMSYRACYTSVTKDGDDLFTFHDGYYEFEAVASKAYQTLSLTRKTISSGGTANIALTRQYNQPQTATPQSNSPKIWTGTINFHGWAKDEAFVVVAPKGLGDAKPIIAIWQWTKDNQGTPKTLSYSTDKQTSEAASATKFTFKQGNYYTLTCQVNAASKGLVVTIKDSSNDAVVQKELTLLPQNTLNAGHRFNPPRGLWEKKTLECTRPNAKPALPRITEALPFPDDLVDTLTYAAAFVDQAGYHAKYAVKQFDKLDRSYHLLEEKAEKRAAKIINLEGEVAGLKTENEGLKKRNAVLEKEIAEDRKKAVVCEAALQEQLRKVLEDLRACESREKKLQTENDKLRDYIKKDTAIDAERQKKWEEWKQKDAKEDAERERKWEEHDKADHEALKRVQQLLMEAEANGRRLSDELATKNKKIAELQSSLDVTRCDLKGARTEIDRLECKLAVERKSSAEVQKELDAALERLRMAEKDLTYLRRQVENLTSDLAAEKKKNAELQDDLKEANRQLKNAKGDIVDKDEEIKEKDKQIERQKTENEELDAALKKEHDSHNNTEMLWRANGNKLKMIEGEYDAKIKKLELKITEMRNHDEEHHKKTGVSVSASEIVLPA